jgi:hypothetical protein
MWTALELARVCGVPLYFFEVDIVDNWWTGFVDLLPTDALMVGLR